MPESYQPGDRPGLMVPVAPPRGNQPPAVAGTMQAAGSKVGLYFDGFTDLSAFSFEALGFTTGSFVVERTLSVDPASAPDNVWTAIGVFKAGTRTSKSTWTDSPGAYHGNLSASSAVRVRVTSALNTPASVRLIAGAGTGTVTIGAMASNEGNVIGTVQQTAWHYAGTAAGTVRFNASVGVIALSGSGVQELAAFVNPANSGVQCRIEAFVPGADATVAVTRWRHSNAADVTTSAAAVPAVNSGGGVNAAKALLYPRGAYTRAGGVLDKVDFFSGTTSRDSIAGGVVVRPGQAVAFSIKGAGSMTLSSYQATLEAVWYELPLDS